VRGFAPRIDPSQSNGSLKIRDRTHSLVRIRVEAFLKLLLLGFLAFTVARADAQLSAADIMKSVAAVQDRDQQERSRFVYEETIRVATRRPGGKLAREERAEYYVTPTATGIDKKRLAISGRYWHKGGYQDFRGEPVPEAGSLDGGLTASMRDDLTNDESKDGLGKDLFPLTSEEQKELKFELEGTEVVEGRPVYCIRFAPKDSKEFTWAGEAVIDKEELQPVSVYTRLSRRIPFFVRAFLGTDVPGLGFNVHYKRLDKDVWFPDSFGTEFRLRAVFFINRTITISMESKNFKRTSVDSQIHFEDPK
jgi:hypothetical protein